MSEIVVKSQEQKVAEADVDGFRKALGPFVVAAETTRMAMVFTDAKEAGHPIIFANESFLSLTGYSRPEVLGQKFCFLMGAETSSQQMAQLAAVFEGSSRAEPEINYRRKNGSAFWAATFINPVRDESGDIVQHFVSLVDLSKHKEAHAQAMTLIDELNHRVKNTLSTVQSIVWQAFRNSSDANDIRDSVEDRLFALSRSHDLLAHENWENAGLVDVVNAALEPFKVAGRSGRIVITGGHVRLPPKVTLALGIALHELATNAAKYGAFSNAMGTLSVAWAIELAAAGNRLILHWQEKGGPPVTRPTRKGFGSQVLERGLAYELEGSVKLDYHADGVMCTIDIPAPRGARGG